MVTVEFTQRGKGFALVVYGHAGAAQRGQDLICSAVSALTYTAAQCALDLYGEGALRQFPEIVTESGDAQVAAVATEEGMEQVQQMFRTVATGLEMLARQYPENVHFVKRIKMAHPEQEETPSADKGD